MRFINKYLPILIAMLMISAAFYARQAHPKDRVPLVADQDVYDFGEVRQGSVVQHAFLVRNEGKAPVVIERVKTSCGCTTSVPESDMIGPGQSVEIRVTFRTADRQGRQTKETVLYFDAAEPVKLVLRGKVVPELKLRPNRVTFKEMHPGEIRKAVVRVKNTTADPLKITSLETSSGVIAASFMDEGTGVLPLVLGAGESARFEVAFTMPEKMGSFRGSVSLGLADRPGAYRLSLSARIKPDWVKRNKLPDMKDDEGEQEK